MGEHRFAQSWSAHEEHMGQSLAVVPGCFEGYPKASNRVLLSDPMIDCSNHVALSFVLGRSSSHPGSFFCHPLRVYSALVPQQYAVEGVSDQKRGDFCIENFRRASTEICDVHNLWLP
jgi:hypothetical protein